MGDIAFIPVLRSLFIDGRIYLLYIKMITVFYL